MGPLEHLGPADVVAAMATYRDALRLHQEVINRLNVYPVPDGDTGTNMALTVESVVAEIGVVPANGGGAGPAAGPSAGPADAPAMAEVCKAVAHGSLMGARGNSGVILSQLLRGLTGVLGRAEEVAAPQLAEALAAASDAARQAVLRPVEGTILTVARAAAQGAGSAASDGAALLGVLEEARGAAAEALAHTPEQLPALARAGVVDAGGSGYLLMIDALLTVTDGRALPEPPTPSAPGCRSQARCRRGSRRPGARVRSRAGCATR